jgi:hypothetical protein
MSPLLAPLEEPWICDNSRTETTMDPIISLKLCTVEKIGKVKRCSIWRNNPEKIANFVCVQALANLLHHYFLCKEGIGIVTKMGW